MSSKNLSKEHSAPLPMKNHHIRNTRGLHLFMIFQEKALWLLLLIIALFFVRPLFLGESFFLRDIYKFFLPQKRLLQEFLLSGEWPLWDRYIHGGHPYPAAPGSAALYPFNILYIIFPLITAFNLSVILHFFICATSAYLFARVIGFSSIPSMIVGIAYTFGGLSLSQVNLLHTFFSSAYLPLLFLCWHLFLTDKKQRWFVLAVIINVLRLLLVAPEQYVIGSLLLAGWTCCYPYPSFRARSKILFWSLLNVFAFGIAAVQFVPLFEMLSQSSRGEGLSYRMFTFWSLPPLRFPEFIFPQFSGYIERLAASDYWGRGIDEDTPMTLILSIYWGCSLVFLTISAGLDTRRDSMLPRIVRHALLLTVVLSVLLATGRYLPFFEFIYRYVPFIKIFRFPVKFLWFSMFPVAILAGYRAECHWGRSGRSQGWVPSRSLLFGLWGGVAFLGLCTALWAYSPTFSENFHQFFFKHPGDEVSQQGLLQAFLHAFGIWTLLTLLYQHRSRTKTRWQPALFCGIILLDLLVAGKSLNPTVEKEFYTSTPPAVALVRQHLNSGRLYRMKVSRHPILRVPDNHIVWGVRWNLDVLEDYSAAFYRIPTIFHADFDSLANFRMMTLRSLLERAPWSQKISLLSAAGVTAILTDEVISEPDLRYIATIPNQSNLEFHLYKNQRALGQAQFVASWEFVDSDDAAESAMLDAEFDPRQHAVLQLKDERSESIWFWGRKEATPVSASLAGDNDSCQDSAELRELHSSSSSISLSINAPCDGYVVLEQPFYPGWHARLDGESTPLLRANLAFSAIFVPQGHSRIRLFYAPVSAWLGGGTSLVFLGLLIIGISTGALRKIF